MSELVHVPVGDTELTLLSALVDGKPVAAFRPIVEMLGMGYGSQLQKLKSKSWATVTNIVTVGADGKSREMAGVDRKTLTMYLATLDENRVKPEFRPNLISLQSEAAEALDAYFHEGGAINPSATPEQASRLMDEAERKMRILNLAKGMVDPGWIETKTRYVVSLAFGEEPEIEPTKRTLTVSDYLEAQGITAKGQRRLASTMGRLIAKAFRERYDTEPGEAPRFIDGAERPVKAYAERDRDLFDEAWEDLRPSIDPTYFRRATA